MIESQAPILYDLVGLIPATNKTPDIYYCGDPSSEKVAALTFLTLWFLDSAIQMIVKSHADSVICGLSPLSGGHRLEKVFKDSSGVVHLGRKMDVYDYGSRANEYAGTCTYPIWDDKGHMVRKGRLAVYATSSSSDEKSGYTARWRAKFMQASEGHDVPSENALYHTIYYRRENDFGIHMIFEAFQLPEDRRDECLAGILKNEFSDINSLYDMVPKRTTHEVAHLLERYIGLSLMAEITDEVRRKIPVRNSMLSHYATPREAIAELAGISLLQQVKRNAQLDFGMPTTMLDKVLDVSAIYVDERIGQMSSGTELKREP